jgi:hypothetical protein
MREESNAHHSPAPDRCHSARSESSHRSTHAGKAREETEPQKVKFEIKPHSLRAGVNIVEVMDDSGRLLLATITPGDTDRELRVVSRHFRTIDSTPLFRYAIHEDEPGREVAVVKLTFEERS